VLVLQYASFTEIGIAIGRGIPVYVLSADNDAYCKTNTFYWHESIHHVTSIEQLMDALSKMDVHFQHRRYAEYLTDRVLERQEPSATQLQDMAGAVATCDEIAQCIDAKLQEEECRNADLSKWCDHVVQRLDGVDASMDRILNKLGECEEKLPVLLDKLGTCERKIPITIGNPNPTLRSSEEGRCEPFMPPFNSLTDLYKQMN